MIDTDLNEFRRTARPGSGFAGTALAIFGALGAAIVSPSAVALTCPVVGSQFFTSGEIIVAGSQCEIPADAAAVFSLPSGKLDNWGVLNNLGSLTARDGAVINNYADASIVNSGQLALVGQTSALNNYGTFVNTLVGRVSALQGRINNYGSFTNQADVGQLGSLLVNKGKVANLSSWGLSGALLQNESEITNGGRLLSDTQLDNSATGVMNNQGLQASEGFWNDGLVNNAGSISTGIINSSGNTGTLNNQGEFHATGNSGFHNTGLVDNTGTFNNHRIFANDGRFLNSGTLVNEGEFLNRDTFSLPASGNLSGTGRFTQASGVSDIDGLASQSDFAISGGELSGTGTLNGSVVVNGGVVAPGHSPGTLSIGGSLDFSGGTLEIEIGGTAAGEFDLLQVGGATRFAGGTILFEFLEGFVPGQGESSFRFLSSAGGITGLDTMTIAIMGLLPGFHFQLDTSDLSRLTLNVFSDVAPVPVPASFWLLGSGLIGLLRMAARDRRAVS
jgi:hypothetical protein